MADEVKKMSPKEFREEGYLQELNRLFLHPLGLALETVKEPDGSERFGDVWDYRDDPEGMVFGEGVIDPEKIDRIMKEFEAKIDVRQLILGGVVQKP